MVEFVRLFNNIKSKWNILQGQEKPMDAKLWHKWETGWFVRTVTGEWAVGSVWRRLHEGKWKYQEREKTLDEWLDWQI
jgi:hypothetical protein